MWLFPFVIFITILLTWAVTFPQQTRAVIAELKRHLRLWVIQYYGEKATQEIAQEFYHNAVQNGHDPKLVKKVLDENWEIIRDRLGTPLANDILGEPSPLERYG